MYSILQVMMKALERPLQVGFPNSIKIGLKEYKYTKIYMISTAQNK